MTVKKILSLLIAVALVLSMLIPAFAEETGSAVIEKSVKINKDQAKEIAIKMLKDHFNTEIDEKKFQISIESVENYENPGNYVWHMNWNFYDQEKSVYHRVTVDANTGKVLGVDSREYLNRQETPVLGTITEEEAQEMAESFIKKLHPKEFEELAFKGNMNDRFGYPTYGPTSYLFQYIRKLNGLEYTRNDIQVEIDAVKGTVVRYNYRWEDQIEAPSIEGIMDEKKALEIFQEKIKMGLSYIPYRNEMNLYDEKVNQVKLVYSPQFLEGYMIDAKEGKILDWMGRNLPEKKVRNLTDKQKEEILKKSKVLPGEAKEIDNDRALEVMKEKVQKLYGEGYEIDNVRYVENENYWGTSGRKAWIGYFRNKTGGIKAQDAGEIIVDAMTGELITFMSHYWDGRPDEEFEPALTWEKSYDQAIDYIIEHFPSKADKIQTEQNYVAYSEFVNGKEIPQRYYYFHFPRVVNDILYSQDHIALNFDAKTGKVRELRMSWNDELQFPDTKKAISKEEAAKLFFEKHQPKLMYNAINKSNDYRKPQWEVKAVYQLDSNLPFYSPGQLDAITGGFVNHYGQEITEKSSAFKTSIQGHWAEKELSILASQGIIDTKTFDLNKEITKMDAFKMLVNAKGYHPYMVREASKLNFGNYSVEDANYKYLQMAVAYGLIENKDMEFNAEEKITREEMAVLMMKLLKYDSIASAKGIYNLPFTDAGEVSEDKVGAVAICRGLGIIGGYDGKFRPKDKATMVEMAVAIYKSLESLKTK